jgi:hypothetical protein
MPQQRSNKAQTPINSDAFNLTPDLATLADTLGVIVPVADRTEADSVATARAAAGWPISDSRPLFVWRTDIDTIEVKDSAGWRGHGAVVRHMEFAQASFSVAGGYASWDAGALSVDTGQTVNGGFAQQSGTSGTINFIETGWYSVHVYTSPQGATADNAACFIRKNGVTVAVASTNGFPAWDVTPNIPRMKWTAGDNMTIVLVTQTARTWTTRVYLDKLDN